MYLDEKLTENDILRQGDILKEIHAVGVLNLNGIIYQHDTKGKVVGWSVNSEPRLSYVMVLSHSCEIDPNNSIKLTSIILAPVRDLSTATKSEKIEELRNSNIITEDTESSYFKYFCIDPHPSHPFEGGGVVDFSKCFSVRKNCYELLVSKKVAQLRPEISDAMALKCALYFKR